MSSVVKNVLKPIPKQKLLNLEKLQCQIFRTTFNPTKQRTGAKILRQPLKGQTVTNYYGPADFPSAARIVRLWKNEEYEVVNEDEEYRLDRVEDLKRRGKGAPKKKREASSGNKKK
ncbi:DEKNAAC104921 [Brettanomyces naardenensis]|uniref:Small ribosomal subunit protein mS33 n=1 Tax=Brettanomyces naardenensis TaxID=13370 RepID=A0A448YSH6_BRENA|nr:DEKNAAC104921 [Brettanomyces naardenensis]